MPTVTAKASNSGKDGGWLIAQLSTRVFTAKTDDPMPKTAAQHIPAATGGKSIEAAQAPIVRK